MKRAIVAEDDEAIREYVCSILEKLGFLTIPVSGGNQAFKIIRESGADLLVTDIIMDDGEGIEEITKLRQLGYTIPVIAISGAVSGTDYLSMAKALGANQIFGKPIERKKFEDYIRMLFPAM